MHASALTVLGVLVGAGALALAVLAGGFLLFGWPTLRAAGALGPFVLVALVGWMVLERRRPAER